MPASWSGSHPPTEIGGEKSAHDPNQKKTKRGDGEPAIPIMLLMVSLS